MRRAFSIAFDAYWHFLADDGWAIASHIALSALMAMFPFFIVLTALAGLIFGSADLGDVLVAAVGSLALGFLVVLGPLIFRTALRYAPWLEPLEGTFTFFRFAIAVVVLTIALFVAHKWLPAGRRRVIEILPGIVATLVLWLATGIAFSRYLAEYSFTYVNTYAGLASAMVALVFLYWTASIFVYGGELNSAIFQPRPIATQNGGVQNGAPP